MYMSGNILVDTVAQLQAQYDLSRNGTVKLSPEDEYALLQKLNKAKLELSQAKTTMTTQGSFWDKLSSNQKMMIYAGGGIFGLLVVASLIFKRS